MDQLFQYQEPVLLVGAGKVNAKVLTSLPKNIPAIGVDGGGNSLQKWGRSPCLILGDMDSFVPDPAITCPIHPIKNQDSTDFEKALKLINAPLLIGLGFLSDRLDHAVAALDALAKAQGPTMLIGESDCVAILGQNMCLQLPLGTRVSVVPWPKQSYALSEGLKYPLNELSLELTQRLGTSNESLNENIVIRPQPGGRGLIMLPWQHHHELAKAITA